MKKSKLLKLLKRCVVAACITFTLNSAFLHWLDPYSWFCRAEKAPDMNSTGTSLTMGSY